MKEQLGQTSVKGYNKSHAFSIERYSVSGHTFYHFLKNGNIVLNCTEPEIQKLGRLFKSLNLL